MSSQGSCVHVTRRNFLRGIGLLSASAALAACSQSTKGEGDGQATEAPTPMLAIIHTNDTHGHDVEVKTTDNIEGNFSMAVIPSLKADWEAKGYEVILVDAGDATQGMPLVNSSSGLAAIAFMNSCGYDLMAVGNHEFDWGLDKLSTNEKQAKFPLLSANILLKDTGEPLFAANKVVELANGAKVGFFGLTTPATLTTTNPKNVATLNFLREKELLSCAQAQVDELRNQGCDLVVCVGHLGNEESSGKSTSRSVLEAVTGIDLFIDGHDHEVVEEEVAGTLLVETGSYMHNIGVVVIDDGAPTNEPVAYGAYDGIDAATQAIIDQENDRVKEELGVVLGATPFFLDGEREPGVRTQETNLGDFCADAFRWAAEKELAIEVDCAVVNGGAIRSSVEAGDISLDVIKTVMPYTNSVAVIDVTGAQLLEAIEASCQFVGTNMALGAFPQVSGMIYKIDASVPYEEGPTYPGSTVVSPAVPGGRVTIMDVGGRGFDKDETYSVAASDFLCNGGDAYYTFKEAANAKEPVIGCFDYEALSSYLVVACDHTVPDEYAESQGRITIVGLS